jgi:hypothetical protein
MGQAGHRLSHSRHQTTVKLTDVLTAAKAVEHGTTGITRQRLQPDGRSPREGIRRHSVTRLSARAVQRRRRDDEKPVHRKDGALRVQHLAGVHASGPNLFKRRRKRREKTLSTGLYTNYTRPFIALPTSTVEANMRYRLVHQRNAPDRISVVPANLQIQTIFISQQQQCIRRGDDLLTRLIGTRALVPAKCRNMRRSRIK